MTQALIHHVYDSSFVDGPGNRMAVFFQGCNMNCWYCHNPETIGTCVNCGQCVLSCKSKALSFQDGKIHWNSTQCTKCYLCEKNCPNQSSPRIQRMEIEDLVLRVRKNRPFITGITCSGGECTLQRDYIIEFFKKVKEENGMDFSCFLDSNGSVLDFEQEDELLSVVDGVMLDIKEADPLIHQMLTGQPNDLVLKNAVFLAKEKKLVEIRTVVLNKNIHAKETIEKVADCLQPYLEDCDILYRLIPFRTNGVREEYKSLGSPTSEQMELLAKVAKEAGFSDVRYT